MGTLNQSTRGTYAVGRSDTLGLPKYARAYYDFATDGGAVGAINLRGDKLPSGAVVVSSYIKIDTLVATTGGTGTVALGLESATDLRTAVVVGTAPAINAVAVKQALVTNAAPLLLTADRHVVATIATATVTAGRFSVIVEYFEPFAAV